ncbi:sodium-dependent transporter [Caproicibacterium sp. XB2]|uniref:sodium-dependent transporter n=1 Tax=Caproicibacterium sp. XB2 TaxID=3388458 RepID=UPI00384F1FD2|nr:sodium-dependent transporter [Oscillospiraceae bacterium]
MEEKQKSRASFTSRIGFVMAAAGSAAGLGNIWRFPYLAAKYGGGAFLLVYIILAVTFGFSLMIVEFAIGRKTHISAIEAYGKLDHRFKWLGYLASIVPIIILPYYCVIGGWVFKYFGVFISGQAGASSKDGFFSNYIGQTAEPIVWFMVFMIATAIIVMLGVEKGVEKVSRTLMPLLLILSIVTAVYSLTLPNAMAGVKYYLIPDFSHFSVNTVLAALGQLFYSLSLAMGITVTYGSYCSKKDDLEVSATQVDIFDTGVALLAGLTIIPAVFSFSGGSQAQLQQGPGLMFVMLPKVFSSMGFGGVIAGAAFFLLVLFAALTSSIALMETVVSIFQDKLHIGRMAASILTLAISVVLGLLSSLGFGALSGVTLFGFDFLDFFDFISNSILMPLVALFTCILVGWVVGMKTIDDEVTISSKFRREKLCNVMIKWIAPIFIILILVSSVLNSLGIIKL